MLTPERFMLARARVISHDPNPVTIETISCGDYQFDG